MAPTAHYPFRLVLAAVLAAAAPAAGVTPPELIVDKGMLHVPLPESPAGGVLQELEWSANLAGWEPVARDYGFAWENPFPHAHTLDGEPGAQVFVHGLAETSLFFRLKRSTAPVFSNRQLVSRFLQQATFGPTRELISGFPGIDSGAGFNDYPYSWFEQWIDDQMALEVTSLRKFWRRRSNPAFTDNSANSPFEVGHDPALGTQLPYYTYDTEGTTVLVNPDPADALAAGRASNDVSFAAAETKQIVWYQAVLTAPDALRQRAAWALSQIFVVGEAGSSQVAATERWLVYYDIFLRYAFGNFRDILGEVTFSPLMGDYLTFVDNLKADPAVGTYPDENYARELMQLFTIGLWMLNQDGTQVLDAQGRAIPSYDNDDIFEFAKILTGLRRQLIDRAGIGSRDNIETQFNSNYIDPMRMQSSRHDFSAKTLLDGSTLGPYPATDAGALDEINAFLDHLFNHPNTAPFIARRLIQRLSVSNPSPNYIHAVAQAFAAGTWNGSGSGRRGDLSAVFKAILLHPEAREPALAADAAHGRLREPVVRLLHYARAFNITSPQTYGLLPFYKLNEVFAQSPFDSPSVFNFYLPDYQPVGAVQDRGLYGPEFQILTDVTSIGLANAIRTLVHYGIRQDGTGPMAEIGARYYSQGDLDLAYETALAADPAALLDHLDLMLTAGRLTPANRTALLGAIDPISDPSARVKLALSLISLLPEFNILY